MIPRMVSNFTSLCYLLFQYFCAFLYTGSYHEKGRMCLILF